MKDSSKYKEVRRDDERSLRVMQHMEPSLGLFTSFIQCHIKDIQPSYFRLFIDNYEKFMSEVNLSVKITPLSELTHTKRVALHTMKFPQFMVKGKN